MNDKDVKMTSSFYIDVDCRNNISADIAEIDGLTGKEAREFKLPESEYSNDEIKDDAKHIVECLKNHRFLRQWSYVVFTGN